MAKARSSTPSATGSKAARVTLKAVAEACGVSLMTVSLAMRHEPRIPEETRRRVERMAKKMGYRQSPELAELMERVRGFKQRRYHPTVAVLRQIPHTKLDRYSQVLIEGARDRLDVHGYRLEAFDLTEEILRHNRLAGILETRAIRGALIPPLPDYATIVDMDFSRLAVVAMTLSMHNPPVHRVAPSGLRNTRFGLEELWRRGARRIAMLIQKAADIRTEGAFHSAYLKFQADHLAPSDWLPVLGLDLDRGIDDLDVKAFMVKHRPDAILAEPWLVDALVRLGWRVPEDVAVAVWRDPKDKGTRLAGLDQNPMGIGAAAADLVVAHLKSNDFGLPPNPVLVHIRANWVDGDTVGPTIGGGGARRAVAG